MLSPENKIFITGASGFVGSNIVRKLIAEGYINIYCLKRPNTATDLCTDWRDKVYWLEGDIMDVCTIDELLKGMDVVIHAAAKVSFETGAKKNLIETSMHGTANMVNCALYHGIKKFIYISSVAAIGRRKIFESIDENLLFSYSKYDTSYGLAKFLGEQEVWRGHAEGLNVTILNPSMILGTGNWHRSSVQLFRKIFEGMAYYPIGTTGWVDVDDVALAVSKCMTYDHDGQRYIISAENLSYKHVFSQIADGLRVKHPMKALTPFYSGILWRLEALKSYFTGYAPIITKETVLSTSVTSEYNNAKSKAKLDIRYTPVNDALFKYCEAFLAPYSAGKA
jgi:nucleoside-diphosphate-sugar epimerase